MNWQEIKLENRRTIIIVVSIVIVLIAILAALIGVKASLDAADEPPIAVQTEQAPAPVSDLDVNQYVNQLHSIIKKEYGTKLDGYQIATGELLEDGSWYVTTFQIPLESQWSPAQDVFRIILHQVDGKWQIVTEPSLIFAYADYPGIPRAVIYSANNL